MYRDDEAALRSQIEQLTTELTATRASRRAAAEEARALREAGEETRRELARRRAETGGAAYVIAVLLLLVAGGFSALIVVRCGMAPTILEGARTRLERELQEVERTARALEALSAACAKEPALTPATQPPEATVGWLVANSVPFARVLVDDKDTGLTTPIPPRSKLPLQPGPHQVTFVVDQQRFTFTVQVVPGQVVRLIKKLPVP